MDRCGRPTHHGFRQVHKLYYPSCVARSAKSRKHVLSARARWMQRVSEHETVFAGLKRAHARRSRRPYLDLRPWNDVRLQECKMETVYYCIRY